MHLRWALAVGVAVAVAVGICVWLLADGFGPARNDPRVEHDRPAVAWPSVAPASRPVAAITASPFQNPEADVAPSPLLSPVPDGPKVRVIDGETGQPVPGAEIVCCDRAAFDAAARLESQDARVEQEDALRSVGKRFLVGADGTVTVVPADGGLWVFARFGLASGAAWLVPPHPEMTDVTIRKDASITVRVVDAVGRGAGNLEIVCALVLQDRVTRLSVRRSRIEDGVVQFRNVFLGVAPDTLHEAGTLEIFPRYAPVPPTRVTVRADAIPVEPITLTLKPVGTVVVKVEPDGGTPRRNSEVHLHVGDGSTPAAGVSALQYPSVRADSQGVATFENVSAGVPLVITARVPGHSGSTIRSEGIPTHGDTITVPMVAGAGVPAIRIRLIDESAKPCARVLLACKAAPAVDDAQTIFVDRTDEDGRIERNLPTLPASITAIELRSQSREDGPARVVSVPLPSPMKPGMIDLGDVVWKTLPPIVSGRVVDGGGAPVAGASVALQGRKSERFGWNHLDVDAATAARDGSFTIAGSAPDGELAAICWGQWVVQTEPIPVVPGSTGVTLVVERAGGLRGRVALPTGWDAREFHVSAKPANSMDDESVNRSIPVRVEPDGSFETDSVPAGVFTFVVRHSGSPFDPLISIPGIDIVRGKFATDPRLAPLRLEESCLFVTIRARNQANEPVPHPVAGVELPDFPKLTSHSFHAAQPGGGIRIVIPSRRPRTITVGAPGYRAVTLTDVTTDRDVVLSGGLRVDLSFTNVPKLPEGMHLHVTLHPSRADPDASVLYDVVRSGLFQLDESGAASGTVPSAASYDVSLALVVDDLGPEPRAGQSMFGLPHSGLKATVADQADVQLLRFTLSDSLLAALSETLESARSSRRR